VSQSVDFTVVGVTKIVGFEMTIGVALAGREVRVHPEQFHGRDGTFCKRKQRRA